MKSRHDPTPRDDFSDRYIAILLELYWVRSELSLPSPTELAKVRYWQRMARHCEEDLTSRDRKRVLYRARRAEKLGLLPTQLAIVRYSWTGYYLESESPSEIRRRWLRYLGRTEEDVRLARVIPRQVFQETRALLVLFRQIRDSGLWPWNGTS